MLNRGSQLEVTSHKLILSLVPKNDGRYKKIDHFLYLIDCLLNYYIYDDIREMRYTRFQDVLVIVIIRGKNCIIIKQEIRDIFKNIPMTFHY